MGVELPEAITLARQMSHELPGRTIVKAVVSKDCNYLIRQGFMNLPCAEFAVALTGKEISDVAARGKWIFIKLSAGSYLLLAPEMGGRLFYHVNERTLPQRFHLKLALDDGAFLTLRIFGGGFLKVLPYHELEQHRYPGALGLTPLDDGFTRQHFHVVFNGTERAVKAALLDQTRIAGLGNGYLQDILFKVGIHPARKVSAVTPEEESALYHTLVDTMNEAVHKGGSEFELDLYKRPGGYERIVGRHMLGQPCPKCGEPIVKKIILGSSAYLCLCCQT